MMVDPRTNAEALAGLFDTDMLLSDEFSRKKKKAAPVDPAAGLFGITAPKSPWEQMQEKYGTGGSILRMLGTGLSGGLLGDVLMPEMGAGGVAKHKADMELWKEQQKLARAGMMAEPFEQMLANPSTEDDYDAIRNLAIVQPDIYGPVLREMQKNKYAPNAATYTEGEYQFDPLRDEWYLEQQSSAGGIKKTYMGPEFIPASRMLSPGDRENAIGEFDQAAFDSSQRLDNIVNLESQMDEIGEEAWTAGLRGEVSEKWKQVTGTEDPVSMARKQYEGIRTSKAVQNLPPGVASDKDIELVLKPFPTSFTNYEQLREYIAGLRSGEQKIREYNQFGARYLSRPGGGSRRGMAEAWDKHWKEQTSKGGKFYAEEQPQKASGLEDEFNDLWGD
jgi:hypothetical protein